MSQPFRPRNREKTRAEIVGAARAEFARKGYAGARMESIAQSAGVAKELIYHYFKGKEQLFQEVRLQQRADALVEDGDSKNSPLMDPAADPQHLFAWRFHKAAGELEWVKLLTWEAAQGTATGAPCEEVRGKAIGQSVKALKAAQKDGRVSDTFDPRMLQLAVFALATYPLAYAQITAMTTGRAPSDPKFRKDWAAFLQQLGEKVLSADGAPAKKSKGEKPGVKKTGTTRTAADKNASDKTASDKTA